MSEKECGCDNRMCDCPLGERSESARGGEEAEADYEFFDPVARPVPTPDPRVPDEILKAAKGDEVFAALIDLTAMIRCIANVFDNRAVKFLMDKDAFKNAEAVIQRRCATPDPLEEAAIRKCAIEVLANCAMSYVMPEDRNPDDPQKVIDNAIENATKIIRKALAHRERSDG